MEKKAHSHQLSQQHSRWRPTSRATTMLDFKWPYWCRSRSIAAWNITCALFLTIVPIPSSSPSYKLVHSFQNRQIYPREGFIVPTHKLNCPTRPPPSPPPPPLPFDQNQAPTSLKTPPYPHRLFDLQDSLDKLMHFLPQLSDFVPLRNGFYSFRAQTD